MNILLHMKGHALLLQNATMSKMVYIRQNYEIERMLNYYTLDQGINLLQEIGYYYKIVKVVKATIILLVCTFGC